MTKLAYMEIFLLVMFQLECVTFLCLGDWAGGQIFLICAHEVAIPIIDTSGGNTDGTDKGKRPSQIDAIG